MLKSKNLYLYITIGVLVFFTIGYFAVVNKISYAFSYNNEQVLYNNKMHLIEIAAVKYAENNMNIFEKEKSVYITVDDLASLGYLAVDSHGKVLDPTSEVKSLNDIKIRLTNNKEKVEAKIII